MPTKQVKVRDHIKPFLLSEDTTVKEAMRRMDSVARRILFVVNDDNQLIGSLSDGDIRRYILAEGSLTDTLKGVYNAHPLWVEKDYVKADIKQLMIQSTIEGIPAINKDREIVEVLLWADLFGDEVRAPKRTIQAPVVIMAGGKGTRLDPFTRVLPKPLIPVGDKTIIETILNQFVEYGVQKFYVSINHKSKMIKAYFEESDADYIIHFIEEQKPLGTAGSLKFVEGLFQEDVIVSNCDIIIQCDYCELLDFHKLHNYDLTLVGSFRHFTIPYGVCRIGEKGQLLDLDEKPEFDYLVNTGMYVLKPSVIKYIPKNQAMDITDLIKRIKENGGTVGVFPIDEKSWIDVGQWEEYHKSLRQMNLT